MKSLGIIAEYNPFHRGHKYLIDSASALTKADVCISVMSGNFVQRGDFAYFDKWTRAEEAINNGIDLVVELPQVFAASSSGVFGDAGVSILNMLNCDFIAFGSEEGNIETLKRLSQIVYDTETRFSESIKSYLTKGMSYPAAVMEAINAHSSNEVGNLNILKNPNDILALEYLKTIQKKNLSIEPIAIKRKGEGHQESGSKIRETLITNPIHGERLNKMESKYFDLLRFKILSLDGDELDEFDTASEGLGNKIKKEIREAKNRKDLIERVKSKRYTYTRISRLFTHILLGILPEKVKEEDLYIKPLAMNERGSAYLKDVKRKNPDLTIIDDVAKTMKYGSPGVCDLLTIDIKSSDIYSILEGKDIYSESDYVRKPVVLHSRDF